MNSLDQQLLNQDQNQYERLLVARHLAQQHQVSQQQAQQQGQQQVQQQGQVQQPQHQAQHQQHHQHQQVQQQQVQNQQQTSQQSQLSHQNISAHVAHAAAAADYAQMVAAAVAAHQSHMGHQHALAGHVNAVHPLLQSGIGVMAGTGGHIGHSHAVDTDSASQLLHAVAMANGMSPFGGSAGSAQMAHDAGMLMHRDNMTLADHVHMQSLSGGANGVGSGNSYDVVHHHHMHSHMSGHHGHIHNGHNQAHNLSHGLAHGHGLGLQHGGLQMHRMMEPNNGNGSHDLVINLQEIDHMATSYDHNLVEGVICALESGDGDLIDQPKRKKSKGPPAEAIHRDWNEWYNDLLDYAAVHGHCNVPSTAELPGGRKLGWWLTNQRRNKKQGKLRQDRLEILQKLVDMGQLRWTVDKPPIGESGRTGWEGWYDELLKYNNDNGHSNVPVVYETSCGRKLGQWLNNQKRLKRLNKLMPEREAMLQQLVVDGRLTW